MRGYYLEGYSAEKGLPQNTVTDILQTHDGYLWIVTPFGLSRFDGVNFKTFSPGNTPGLQENMFTSLAEDIVNDRNIQLIRKKPRQNITKVR